MNNTEERLWNYIDGNCSPEEQTAITELIRTDASANELYQQFLGLNREFSAIELDEPPMAFTYNVMEVIRTENAQVPLKAAINKRIIKGITSFFTVTILALLVVAISSIKWTSGVLPANLTAQLKLPEINHGQAKIFVQAFVFFDVMLGLYLFDAWLRRKKAQNGEKMV